MTKSSICKTCINKDFCKETLRLYGLPNTRVDECKEYTPTEPSDLISRAEAIKAVLGLAQLNGRVPTDSVIFQIKALPSADRPSGEWIMHGEPPWYVRECSKCGTKWHQWSGDSNPNYCGHCGARMEAALNAGISSV